MQSIKNTIPETGFLRLAQIIGSKNNPPLIPVSKTSWWEGVKSGKYPKSVKLGVRTTVWRVEDIRDLIAAPPKQEVATRGPGRPSATGLDEIPEIGDVDICEYSDLFGGASW